MTQEQLAMMLGVSRQSVTKWEAEKSYPEMDKLIKICQIFEVTLDDLVTGDVTQGELAARTAVPIPKIPVDSCGYDELMRSYALKASTGAALFFLSIAPPMILTSGVLQTLGVPDIPLGVGMAITFALMAAGIALIVLAVTGKSGFERRIPGIRLKNECRILPQDKRRILPRNNMRSARQALLLAGRPRFTPLPFSSAFPPWGFPPTAH